MCSLTCTTEKCFRELEYSILQKQRKFKTYFTDNLQLQFVLQQTEAFFKERFIKALYMHLSSKLLM